VHVGKQWLGLGLVGFVSGAAALVFEALWFHLAGLTFGNSVWASSLVTAAFMAGLALGSGLASRHGGRAGNTLRAYAVLEVAIGLSGIGVVLALPALTSVLAPLFRTMLGAPALLNLTRLAVSFAVMLVPATAMGATLPLLVAAISRGEAAFPRALGWLYGANTLGGVLGVLAGEIVLVEELGIHGTAVAAALLNLTAATVAWLGARRLATAPAAVPARMSGGERMPPRWAAAAALSGALLLALEVVWFRFLILYERGSTLTFAVLLAIVLAGIALGGWTAALWARRDPEPHRWLPVLALAAGSATLLTYATFRNVGWPLEQSWVVLACRLILPGSFLSGLIFTFLGGAVRRAARDETQAAGRLTLFNTAGAMGGALLGGFVLLPHLGTERSFLAVAAAYGALAALVWPTGPRRAPLAVPAAATGLLALCFAFLPSGLTRRHYENLAGGIAKVHAVREGLTDTVAYLRHEWGGEPHYYQLVTNGHSMSSTVYHGQFYMKLYVYWAMAVHPEARRALLICYGVGNTAKALVDERRLQTIDVVDISRDVLDLASVPYPPPATPPLHDPRVRVHVEDGRFFLLTTAHTFDLITAEPPPPKNAGVVNLYSREFFTLLHGRLNEGGVATYWLPVGQLTLGESRGIVRAFCAAFADCTLWSGGGGEWMLAGTRNGRAPIDPDAFVHQWGDERVAPELRRLGLEVPATLGALFIADAPQLAEWTIGVPPVSDLWPRRITPDVKPSLDALSAYRSFTEAQAARVRFMQSPWIRRFWPHEIREHTLEFFLYRKAFDDIFLGQYRPDDAATLRMVLTTSRLQTLPLLLMGADPAQVDIARRLKERGVRDGALELVLGADALSRRDYTAAVAHLDACIALAPGLSPAASLYRNLARELGGRAGAP
jgi:predicted membrane-bound spermidine synthase